MKKVFALLLALLLVVGTFASCGGKSSDKDELDDVCFRGTQWR